MSRYRRPFLPRVSIHLALYEGSAASPVPRRVYLGVSLMWLGHLWATAFRVK